MSEDAEIKRLIEPGLQFRYGQAMADPRDGLSLFGPPDTELSSHPRNITYGVIGTTEGIKAFAAFSDALTKPQFITPEPKNRRLWLIYPGFEAAFHCTWPKTPAASHLIDSEGLSKLSRHKEPNQRAFDVVNVYLDGIKTLKKRDEAFNVFICVVPDEVWLNCRSQSHVSDGVGVNITAKERQHRIKGQMHFFDDYNPDQYRLSTDFRRQIKARAMEYDVPIQIVRESTLTLTKEDKSPSRGLTPLSDRAWNLSTALYYKAGGKPWKLTTAREGVSYVGLAFRRADPKLTSSTAVCAAQMFIDSGDGIVFLGEYGQWWSSENKQFHLTGSAAKNLLAGVIGTYKELDGRPLKEIFLHSRSDISREEFEGYKKACPEGVKLVGIRVKTDRFGLRLYREGTRPVLRGTFLKLNQRTGFLWAAGFKPELGTYDGWEVPAPLRLDIQHGEGDIEQIASDIMSLTKLNYNACKLGSSQPVTVGFSDAVGEILVSNPDIKHRRPQFKFYI
ncbi:MAG TPA: hypothetical protein VJB90_03950 [Candidatus Nanoarchaeia archaeon]|nr:hypothetical protein [Candidatus Nanoarchaeia archaeon]